MVQLMHGNFQDYRTAIPKARESAFLRGVELGSKVAFNRNYCVLTVKAFGFIHGQVVADMRGVVTEIPEDGNPRCLVRWDGREHAHETHMAHLELAERVDQTSHGRYLPWIDY